MKIFAVLLFAISTQTFATQCDEIVDTIKSNILNKALIQKQIETTNDRIVQRRLSETTLNKQMRSNRKKSLTNPNELAANELEARNIQISLITARTDRKFLEIERSNLELNQSSLEKNNELLEDIYQSSCTK